MDTIKEGQIWREKARPFRELRAKAVNGGDLIYVEYTRREHGDDWLSPDDLRLLWECVEPAPKRKIVLELAADTTETECGACPLGHRGNAPPSHCRQFDAIRDAADHARRSFYRLPECIAAESK